jgi:hypothetical protein
MLFGIIGATLLGAGAPALADDLVDTGDIEAVSQTGVVGAWTGGSLALTVQADGRFDWAIGRRVTDGTWTRGAQLLSLATDQWERVYAYRVEGDTLTLYDVDGTELVMHRDKRPRRSVR